MATVQQHAPPPDPAAAIGDQSVQPSRGLRATSVWLIVCLLILLWWTIGYRSLVEMLAEWQFAHLGRYYPSLTVSAVVLVLALPIALLVGAYRRRRRLRFDTSLPSAATPEILVARAIRSAERSRLFFAAVAIVSALVAAGVFIHMLSLPSDSGPVRTVVGVAGSVQPEGAAAYARPLRIGRVARIEENVGLARRVMYIAPVFLPHGQDGGAFLTVVEPDPTPPLRFTPIASGVLVERGLPREVTNLYRAAAIAIPERSYLLMRDGAMVRWRSLVLGIQTALLALAGAAVSLLFGRQARRLRQVIATQSSSIAT
jgi:hypothetical protein